METSESPTPAALVLGGSGVVGSAVVSALSAAGARTFFTYFRRGEQARALQAEQPGSLALEVDLRQPGAVRSLFLQLDAESFTPRLLVHCAAVSQARRL